MSTDLERRVRAAVREVADAVPVDRPDPCALIQRARPRPARTSWWRLAVPAGLAPVLAAAAVLGVVALAAGGPGMLLPGPRPGPPPAPADPVGGGRPVLPDTLARTSPFTATVSDAPPGPAILAYGQGGAGPRWAKSGRTVVLAADGRTYRLVDEAAWRGEATENGDWHDAPVLLSPDGTRLAVGALADVDTIAVVDLRTGETRTYPAAARGPVDVLAWSPDGQRLGYLSRAEDGGGFRILDLGTGTSTPVRLRAGPLPVKPVVGTPAMAFSPDGRRLAVQAEADTPDERQRGIWFLDLEPDGHTTRDAVMLGVDFGWRLVTGAAWSPDGRVVAVTDNAASGKRMGAVRLLDPRRGQPLPSVTIPRETVTVLGWRSATRLLLTEEQATDAPALFEADLNGLVEQVSRTEAGWLGGTNTYRMTAATALLSDAQVRPAAEPDRGPWPQWLRLSMLAYVVVCAALLALAIRRALATRRARSALAP